MAPILYTAKGQQIQQRLWEETLKEFEFVAVGSIIDEVTE